MEIKRLYLGSWVPRTILHLEEFYHFIKKGESHLRLNEEELKRRHRALKIGSFQMKNQGQEYLETQIDAARLRYYEDGLMILDKKVTNLKKDQDYLSNFALKEVFKTFSYLYSLGAPIPKIFTAIFSILPFIISVDKTSEGEIKKIFEAQKDENYQTLKNGTKKIYLGKEIIILEGFAKEEEELEIVKSLIFAEDCHNQFQKILNLHRFIWEEIDKIKARQKLPFKKLSGVRDTLLELNNEVIFFSSRLKQIISDLDEKTNELQSLANHNEISAYLKQRYASLKRTSIYTQELWQMTQDNAAATLNLITLLYQESTQRELNVLQVIFIIGTIASLLALGSVYGFNFQVFDASGQRLFYGDTVSFTFFDLARFGLSALGLGILVYGLFFSIYNRFSHSKITNPEKLENQEIDKIKTMFK